MPVLPINWINLLKPVVGFSAEYQAVYDYWTNKPDSDVAKEQDQMVRDWIDSGYWAERDVIYVHAVHTNDNGEAVTNWKNPGTFDAVIVNAPAFVAFEGFTGDGATTTIDYNYNPSTDGVKYLLDDSSVTVYSRTTGIDATVDVGIFDGVAITQVRALTVSINIGSAFNQAVKLNSEAITGNTGAGMYAIDRSASAEYEVYMNGNNEGTEIDVTTSIPNNNMHGLSLDGTILFSSRQLSFIDAGGSLGDAGQLSGKNIFEAYMDSNGKGVIT